MKLLLLLTALAGLANADNLTFSVLQSPVPQSASAPCIICGTTQAHNPATFGYNNFDTTGHTEQLTLFSTNLFASLGNGIEDSLLNNYTAGEIDGVLGLNLFTFGVAVDVNSAEGGNPPTIMQLQSFQLLDLTTASIVFSLNGPIAMPDIRPGNGMGDYLISGFDLSGISAGDRLAFRAQFTGATDGPDSFYIVATPNIPSAVPEPGSWLLLATSAIVVGLALRRKYSSQRL